MRLFQNIGLGSAYSNVFRRTVTPRSFDEGIRLFLEHRYGAPHILEPVEAQRSDAFCALGDQPRLQSLWAAEQGLTTSDLEQILLAQIEHHRTEVFYNLDPMRYGGAFVQKLPGCVKRTVCWRAAPSGNADLSQYDLVVCNFPSILAEWRNKGCRAEYFHPAVDRVMGEYAFGDRPIDVLFFGSYSRHHRARAKVLEEVAQLASKRKIVYCLDASRWTQLVEAFPGGLIRYLDKYRRPPGIVAVARAPVWGRQAYELIGQAKIVLNGAIDMAGNDRGNMRCFEAMGCGALLLSDEGQYPDGMQDGTTIVTYRTPEEARTRAHTYISDGEARSKIAERGREAVNRLYSKSVQWQRFNELLSSI
ncbi:glycosyltransferase family protein [Bradyrhizobium yuanmingense]|uniref:glycosyltransferase family protein n=1 Tax=Bradyrhizobium yuanmingense TaxID=108015 RepID=UPI0023B8F6D8|nr:glycosyltransferase [Bradyrhizobium yuanmingense]MDF0583802.1 glycosyltransferase [Bradyrhizobium yuanmingense]